MALKGLTVTEMISVSRALVTEGTDEHKLLAHLRETQGILPRVAEAHDRLVKTQSLPQKTLVRLAAVIDEELRTDIRHDEIARGVDLVLLGYVLLCKDTELRQKLTDLHLLLLGDQGIAAVIQATYRGEAGAADQLAERLTAEVKRTLKGMDTPAGTLLELVNEWIGCGRKLGALENERAHLEDIPASGPTGLEVIDARNAWIQAVAALTGNLKLADITDAQEQLILGELRRAERKARRRAPAAGDPAAPPAPPAAPAAPATPAAGAGVGG
jgi:hypothetical protein